MDKQSHILNIKEEVVEIKDFFKEEAEEAEEDYLLILPLVLILILAIACTYIISGKIKNENEYIEYWDNNINEVNALVIESRLDNITSEEYYYSITFEFTINSEDFTKTLIISSDNGYPYKKGENTLIYINEFNEIENLTEYKGQYSLWIFLRVVCIISIFICVGVFIYLFKKWTG